MFLPIGGTPNPRNFKPRVAWALIAVNVAVLVFISWPLSLNGVDPGDPLLREYLRYLGATRA